MHKIQYRVGDFIYSREYVCVWWVNIMEILRDIFRQWKTGKITYESWNALKLTDSRKKQKIRVLIRLKANSSLNVFIF